MNILAIDPGTTESAYVIFNPHEREVVKFGFENNNDLLERFYGIGIDGHTAIAIEMIASYGMPVGKEVFETCVWIGRFKQAFGGGKFVYRKDVKMHLCHTTKAKDGNVRQAIIDKFPATGGGKTPQIGTKKQPGPLYGISTHVWAALGVAITYAESRRRNERTFQPGTVR